MAGNDVTILQTSLNTCMPEIKDVAKLFWYLFAIIAVMRKHTRFERMRGCNYSFIVKGAYQRMDGCSGIENYLCKNEWQQALVW